MKKTLTITLALVFVLGIAGSAFAANPFSDVPANHWAYASISKLAEAGIIEGYGSGRFVGSSNITRYEAAQIIAKALARSDKADAAQKAQIERLAAEFAKELESLGVRVGKLEKRLDNVTITGEIRFSQYSFGEHGGTRNLTDRVSTGNDNSTIRTRLFLSGQVNDKWKYTGMLEHNGQNFETNANGSESALNLRRAWVNGKIGVVDVTAGRFYYKPVYGVVFDEDTDGLKLNYKTGNLSFDLFAIRPTVTNYNIHPNFTVYGFGSGSWPTTGATRDALIVSNPRTQVIGAAVGYTFNKKLTANLNYYNVDSKYSWTTRTETSNGAGNTPDNSNVVNGSDSDKLNIVELAVGYKFNKDFSLWGEYILGDEDINDGGKNGWALGLVYGAANRAKPGAFSVRATYFDVTASNVINSTPELDPGAAATAGGAGSWITNAAGTAFYDGFNGFEGYHVGASYIAAKNIELALDYFDFEGQKDNPYKNKLLWTRVLFYF
jgi:hypothetical protein